MRSLERTELEIEEIKKTKTWYIIRDLLLVSMVVSGFMYMVATIATGIVDTLTLLIGISSIIVAVSVAYHKRG